MTHAIIFPIIMLPLIVSTFFSLTCAAVTAGPLAPISVYKVPAYSTAKPCAAGCLVYNGQYPCGFHAGYHDLGKDLGCECNPINACWCSAGIQSAATSYISSCVSAGCSKYGNVEGDVTSMLDLYGGYCATANVEISSKPAANNAVTTPAAATSSARTTTGAAALDPTAATGETPTSTKALAAEEGKDDGLSKSDIIALGTGLGVGVPSLLIGIIALLFQLRRRKAAAAESSQISVSVTPHDSQTHFFPKPSPMQTSPHTAYYELGDRSGMRPPVVHQWR